MVSERSFIQKFKSLICLINVTFIISPWNWIRMKIGSSIVFAEELHSNDGKNIDNDKQDEGEVSQGSKC